MDTPTPKPDESFEQYSIRANEALFEQMPSFRDRNRAIRATWHAHRGPTPEESAADETFDPEKYTKVEDVCIFAEHETTDSQGEPRKYGLKDLQAIVANCNERMRERGSFPAIADRHTSDPKDPNPVEPKVLGYGGPLRLGLIGSGKPTWAIFGDEYRRPDAADTFAQKGRRSVELWTDKKTGRAWFDPITCCGADAPRLPLPAQYVQVQQGDVTLERYTCAAPGGGFASVGAGSTHVPKHKAEPEKYGPDPSEEGTDPMMSGDMLSPEQISQLVDAILATPQMQWVSEQMNETEPGPGMNELPEEQVPPAGETPEDMGGAPPTGDESDLNDLLGGEGGPPPDAGSPPADTGPPSEQDDKEKFTMAAEQTVSVEKYNALAASHTKLVQDHGRNLEEVSQLRSEVAELKKYNADATRRQRLTELAKDRPSMELETELEKVLYSAGSQMTDEQFAAHVDTIERLVPPVVENPIIPEGAAARTETDPEAEKYAQKVQQLAVKLHTQSIDAGEGGMTWDQAKAQAEEQLNQNAA